MWKPKFTQLWTTGSFIPFGIVINKEEVGIIIFSLGFGLSKEGGKDK